MKLWKRFLAWLHYLRHPATIITMDEAPAKGVQIKFSYTGGEYESLTHFDKTKAIADVLVERHKTGKSLTEGVMEEANLLPAMEQRAEEREQEREASLRRAIDWRENDAEY